MSVLTGLFTEHGALAAAKCSASIKRWEGKLWVSEQYACATGPASCRLLRPPLVSVQSTGEGCVLERFLSVLETEEEEGCATRERSMSVNSSSVIKFYWHMAPPISVHAVCVQAPG